MIRRTILTAMVVMAGAMAAGPAAPGAAPADRSQRSRLFLRPAGQARVAGRGQHLHDHDGPRAAPPAVPVPRHAAAAAGRRAGAEFAGLGRDRAARRADRDQRPCREGRRGDPRRAGRPARARGQAPHPGRALRPRPAAHRHQRREVPVPGDARFRFGRGRRHRAGDRQSRSASTRPSPAASSRRWRARRAASTIPTSSSRPMPPSTRAIPAARWSASTAA